MKILFLSFYYPPDLSAGSFRSASLINALLSNKQREIEIEVITTMPNRYDSFAEFAPSFETASELTIHRINTPKHKGGMFGQSKAFVTYAKGVSRIVANNHYDLITIYL